MKNKRHVALLASAILALAACGGSSDAADDESGIASLDPVAASASPDSDSDSAESDSSDDDGDDEPSEEDAEAAFAAYEKCASDLGLGDLFADGSDGVATDVVVDGDTDGGEFIDEEAFERLSEECDPILEDVLGDFELSPEDEAAQSDADLAFARCMRDAGFDFPDPSAGETGGTFEVDGDADPDELDAALSDCDDVYEELFDDAEADQS